jgi:molybdenum cofactor guanylyltransferase
VEFGAVLAGGRGTRFGGEEKALAHLGGTTIIDRIRRTFEQADVELHLITNSPAQYRWLGLPIRGDAIRGRGAISGVHSALRWARDRHHSHALCVACDMPFLRPPLLRHLLDLAASSLADVVVPESRGPLGFEPLCAVYATSSCEALVESLREGTCSLAASISRLRVETAGLTDVERFGDPDVLFLNVNTREELSRAFEIVSQWPSSHRPYDPA